MEISRRALLSRIFVVVPFLLTGCGAPAASPATPSKAQQPAGAAPSSKENPIVVGQIAELTGGQAVTGEYWRAGAKMAVDEWNAKGGVSGRRVELAVEDNASTPTGAINAFNKLMAERKPVGIIGSTYTNSMMAVEPYLRKTGVPLLTGSSGDAITGVGNPWFFRIRISDNILNKLAAEYAVKEMGVKKPSILHVTGDFGVSAAKSYQEYFAGLNTPVVATESYNPDDKDITAQVLSLERVGTDAIIGISYPVDAAMIMTAIYNRGDKIKLIGNGSFGLAEALNLAKEAANGKYVATGWIPSDDKRIQDWMKKLADYSKSPGNTHNSASYDAVNMLLKSVETAGIEPEAVRKALLAIRGYQGIQGEYNFDSKGDGIRDLYFVQIRDGKLALMKIVKGEFKA